jgi:type II secretory pathway pseudopilin PulG
VTLVEMVVAIGIITFLVGISVTALSALSARSERQRTENVIALLDVAFDEWERQADRKLTWGPDEGRYDVWSDRAPVLIISEMLDVVRRTPTGKETLAAIDADHLVVYDGATTPPWIEIDPDADAQFASFVERESLTVLDAWGTPIYATHPGAPAGPTTYVVDDDGTERTINENQYGITRSRRICFVSAGPDGRFGLIEEVYGLPPADRAEAMKDARSDNVYSYVPEWPVYEGH